MTLTESHLEQAAIEWFAALGYNYLDAEALVPNAVHGERASYEQVVLEQRLRSALQRLNAHLPQDACEEALRQLVRIASAPLLQANRSLQHMLRSGIAVECVRQPDKDAGGAAQQPQRRWETLRVIDFDNPDANDWVVSNQFTVEEGQHKRRADVVVFVNGLPLGLLELKNAVDENATIWSAYAQLQTYKAEIPGLLSYNALLVISDGLQARLGSVSANQEWFKVWREIDDSRQPAKTLELEVLINGVFAKQRFLKLLEHFIVFEENPDSGEVHKIIAGYHQFHAVNAAIEETVRASGMANQQHALQEDGTFLAGKMSGGKPGDRRVGVVWHTQGSGKSFTMLFFAARVVREPAMQNPTLVVLTDRNDLDDQLFGQFQRCHEILGQTPQQAASRTHLRELLTRTSGGVIFTTIQKFLPEDGESMPQLSERRNIVVIADEAHRSQYDLIDGLAGHMRDALPCASYIGFTGTPIEKNDANTRAVFGDYISIYDIQRAVADKATVPIYYESRVAKLELNAEELVHIDDEFEEITEGEQLNARWAALESLVGLPKRISMIAEDIVQHFERRLDAMEGKAMIVCISRRVCVDLYNEIIKLRPEWEADTLKVVMTGSAADGPEWQKHIGAKQQRRELATRFKNPKDPFKLVIVRDMWLTGFDAPCLHTMYVDKPMQGHGLMQAIARVNRVFRDKPGGLVVDYLGLADQLRHAMATYTESGGKGEATLDTGEAINKMQEHYGIARDMLSQHGFVWDGWTQGTPAQRLQLIPEGQERILEQEDGKDRWTKTITELSRAFALCAASDEARDIRDDLSYFQALLVALNKQMSERARSPEQVDAAVRQLVSKAVAPEGEIIDVFSAAGLAKPDISILSDEFLAEVRVLKHKHVAAELLEKLLRQEIKVRKSKNVVQGSKFSEKLQKTLNSYHNRAISTMQVIEELIALAQEINSATTRGEQLGLSDDEIAFYDALAANDSAVLAMGDDKLKLIASMLITEIRKNVNIDWNVRENQRANIRRLIKRILNRYGYPPDLKEEAVNTVLAQAELICANLV